MTYLHPRARRIIRRVMGILLAAAVGIGGAWMAIIVFGRTTVQMGPFEVQLTSGFGRGVTDIGLPPFGRLTADTHSAPIRFTAVLREVHLTQLSDTVNRGGLDLLVDQVESDAVHHMAPFGFRVLAVALVGALVAALLAFRTRWRAIAVALLAALLAVGGSEAVAWQTYRPAALLTPTFSGSLALAPKLIGPAQTALDRIDDVRAELSRVLAGAVRVYTSIQDSPGEAGEIRVLHISDIHLSPLGMDFARQLADAFDVDLVIDTGDLTSFGTSVEELILSKISAFHQKYVYVRGNHDSLDLQDAIRRIPNAVVLNGQTQRVAGLRIYGRGDPVFTPNKLTPQDDAGIAETVRAAGAGIKFDVTRLPTPPDVVAVHDDRMAEAVAGLVPLVISGHFHQPSAKVVDGTVFLRVGSTGGAGANVFTQVGGVPLSAEILYFSQQTPHRLVGYDLIEQSPEQGSLQVKRHLIEQEFGALVPTPPTPTAPTPTPTPEPSASPSPRLSVSPSP